MFLLTCWAVSLLVPLGSFVPVVAAVGVSRSSWFPFAWSSFPSKWVRLCVVLVVVVIAVVVVVVVVVVVIIVIVIVIVIVIGVGCGIQHRSLQHHRIECGRWL